ncbi:hypothetical protein OG21DRAFT_1517092 [Imleria badia]|nr:hypothetical protein OG21DRAFT_1517092 [Imleria badia]
MTREAYDQVINAPHKAKLSHELIAAAASYEAMEAWNQHKERNGEQVDYATMKQFLAAAAGAFIDRMIETKGLGEIDRHRARQHAEEYHDNFVDQRRNYHHHLVHRYRRGY